MKSVRKSSRTNWFLLLLLPLLFTSCLFVKGTPFYEEAMMIENMTWDIGIAAIIPPNSTGTISTDNDIVIHFSNSLDTSIMGRVTLDNPFTIYEDNTNCTITFATKVYPNDTIIINPYTDLLASYSYSGISVEGFLDFKGNLMVPISDSVYYFSTAGSNNPIVLSLSPLAGTLGFPASSNLTIVFNESIDTAITGRLDITSSAGVIKLKDGSNSTFYFATTNLPNDTVIIDPYIDLPGNIYYEACVKNFYDPQGNIMLDYHDSIYNLQVAGLVGDWRLDGNGDDSGGNAYDATQVNGTTPTSNRHATASAALLFNGTSDYIDLPAIDTGRSFSISLWMAPLSNNNEGALLSKNSVANSSHDWNAEFVLRRLANKQISFVVGSDSTNYFNEAVTSYLTTANWWYHVVAICQDNGTSYTVSIYINDILMASRTESYPRKSSSSSEPVQIGRYFMTNEYLFEGVIDDVRLYNYALSPAEITALFNE